MKRKTPTINIDEDRVREGVNKLVDGIQEKDPLKIIGGTAAIIGGILG